MSLSRSLARLDRVSLEVLVESAEACARGALLRAALALEMRARYQQIWREQMRSVLMRPVLESQPLDLEFLVERATALHRAADKLRSVQVAAREELASRKKGVRGWPGIAEAVRRSVRS